MLTPDSLWPNALLVRLTKSKARSWELLPSHCRASRGSARLLNQQRHLAKQKILYATEALRKRGMEIAVDVHIGSLRKGIEGYIRNGDVHLIMMRASRGLPIMRLLRRAIELFGLFKRPSFSPVLLLHPNKE